LEAKFSYRLTAAMALSGMDTGALDSYTVAIASDPGLQRLRDLATVIPDPQLSETQARVAVVFEDGARQEAFHDLDKARPLDELAQRLQDKAASLLGARLAKVLYPACESVDLPAIEVLMSRA